MLMVTDSGETEPMSSSRTVLDSKGNQYVLGEMIGQGGQGEVWRVNGRSKAVKLLRVGTGKEGSIKESAHKGSSSTIKRTLDFHASRNIATPDTGYIMELLTGMCSLGSLIQPLDEVDVRSWYLKGGGLARRLNLLSRAAHLLSQIHNKGLVYTDPSPSNIFISKEPDNNAVWLIDSDNLDFESGPGTTCYTPGYGAPEPFLTDPGANSLTDSYAMAVLAFKALTLLHPFIGDGVDDGPPELEHKAFMGDYPWIEDQNDASNRSSMGIPRNWVLSKKLRSIFDRYFTAGRLNPIERPNLDILRLYPGACNATLKCTNTNCGQTFYSNQKNCPWCNSPAPAFVRVLFHLWDPEFNDASFLLKPDGERKVFHLGVVSDGDTFVIDRRLAYGEYEGDVFQGVLSFSLKGKVLSIQSLDEINNHALWRKSSQNGEWEYVEIGADPHPIKMKIGNSPWQLHFGDEDSVHRVIKFQYKEN